MTLLELLLALALCGLLMTATGASLHLFGQLRNRSHAQVSEKQIVRALLDQMARDVRSVCRPALPLVPDDSDVRRIDTSPKLEQSLNLHRSELNVADAPVRPIEFTGTSRWISIHTQYQPPSMADSNPGNQLTNDADPGHHVVWWNGGSLAVPVASDGFRIFERRLKTTTGRTGPAHASFEVTSGIARDTLETEVLAQGYQLGFRYFDGANWRDSWDSHQERQLPRAVELRVVRNDVVAGMSVVALSNRLSSSQNIAEARP
ncbi:MAG: hypothetical protein JNM43_20490 [Planctomycetaceae bacterium]|nr:hypothetical protein [Planctomycetaceae bacterium]